MDLGVLGLDFQGLLIMGNGRIHLVTAGQGQAETVLGFGEVGLDFYGLLTLSDSRIDLAASRRRAPRL